MVPDGSFAATQLNPEAAFNPFLRISLPLRADNKTQLENILQQLQLIGKKIGIAASAFAARLKDWTDDEIEAQRKKNLRILEELLELDKQSYKIGEKIVVARESITHKINAINEAIREEEKKGGSGGSTSSGSSSSGSGSSGSSFGGRLARQASGNSNNPRIERLREQKKKLRRLASKLDKANERREAANNTRDLNTVATQVDDVANQIPNVAPVSGVPRINVNPLAGNQRAAP